MFIELTQQVSGQPCLVNLNDVQDIVPLENNPYAKTRIMYIHQVDGSYYRDVKEDYEAVKEMIHRAGLFMPYLNEHFRYA